MSANNQIATEALSKLGAEARPKIKDNGKHVLDFLEKLQKVSEGQGVRKSAPKSTSGNYGSGGYVEHEGYARPGYGYSGHVWSGPTSSEEDLPGNIIEVTYIHGGSSYEGLPVDKSADFSIIALLGRPFLARNFEVCRDPSGFFTLEWKDNVEYKMFDDCDGYLDAGKLRSSFFPQLKGWIEQIELPEVEIKFGTGFAALPVTLEFQDGQKIYVELVPQISFAALDQSLGLRPVTQMPELRPYMENLQSKTLPGLCLGIALPPYPKPSNDDQLFNISFSVIEKKFFSMYPFIRDLVRLVKIVAERNDWKARFSFQTHIIKQVAIKYYKDLKDTKDFWHGFQALLNYLSQDMSTGTIDDYFITGQVLFNFNAEQIRSFQKEINKVLEKPAKDLFM